MLNKAICFLGLQLIAVPALADLEGPASLALYETIDATSCDPSQQPPVKLKTRETHLHAWLHQPIDDLTRACRPFASLRRNPVDASSITVSLPLVSKKDDPELIDLGYLSASNARATCAIIHDQRPIVEHEDRYAVNYDGSHLIYFGFSLKNSIDEDATHPASRQMKKIGHYLLTSTSSRSPQHRRSLDALKPCILSNVMVNHHTLVEANHFSMKNNHIVLDIKGK